MANGSVLGEVLYEDWCFILALFPKSRWKKFEFDDPAWFRNHGVYCVSGLYLHICICACKEKRGIKSRKEK